MDGSIGMIRARSLGGRGVRLAVGDAPTGEPIAVITPVDTLLPPFAVADVSLVERSLAE